jgi:hypothetical protein
VEPSPEHADFGVVIPASAEHLHWVRGACASVRHFMGDTPICVLVDGSVILKSMIIFLTLIINQLIIVLIYGVTVV